MRAIKIQQPIGVTARKFLFRVSVFLLVFVPFIGFAQSVFIPDEITITGLHRTKKRIVSREIVFRKNLPILLEDTALLFSRTTQNIFNTRLFNYVNCRIDSIYTDSCGHDHGRVNFHLHERWYTFPNPIFELSDRNFNEWWYDRGADLRRVNIGLRFIQKNVRGLNEDLVFSIQGGFNKRLEFSYLIPYLDKRQTWGLRFGASATNNKEVAVRSVNNRLVFNRDENSFGRERYGAFASFSKRKSIYLYHYFDFSYSYNRISSFIFDHNPLYFNDFLRFQRYSEFRYSVIYDRRDLRYFATKGYYLFGTAARTGLMSSDNLNLWSARLVGAKYLDLGKGFYLASKADVEWSTPGKQPYLGTRSLGYENRFVRGYERFVMEGPINMHTRNSLRFKAASFRFSFPWMPVRQFQFMPLDIYLTGFGDAGLVVNPNVFQENKRRVNTLLVGYGLGLNLVTFYDVIFRAEYSLNIHGDQGFYISFLTDI